MIQAGAVGNITEVHAGCDAFKDVYCQIRRREQLATERPPVPAHLDWDLWLGPAAMKPYHPVYVPFSWRGHAAFGSGCLGDWVCHVLDPVFWALDLEMPSAITAETKGYDPKTDAQFFPEGTRITFEFPAKGARGPVKIVWHDGSFSIPQPEELTQENRKVTGTKSPAPVPSSSATRAKSCTARTAPAASASSRPPNNGNSNALTKKSRASKTATTTATSSTPSAKTAPRARTSNTVAP
jgi:hypothetical protein